MMKVGLFVGEDCSRGVQGLLRSLERKDIPASAFRLSTFWSEAHTDEIRHNFSPITHAVFFLSEECRSASWFPFVAGYCMGRDMTILLYNGTVSAPSFLDGYERFSDALSLSDFLENELLIAHKAHRVEQAQAELEAAALPLTEASFMYAVDNSDVHAVRNFLRVGFSPDIRDENGVPLLSHAIRQGNEGIMRLLIEHGANVNAVSDDRANTPLMEAATRGDVAVVRRLLEAGADLDLKTKYGQTALMLAVGEARVGVAQLLLEYGAKTDAVDYLGMTAWKYAELFRSQDILDLLSRSNS